MLLILILAAKYLLSVNTKIGRDVDISRLNVDSAVPDCFSPMPFPDDRHALSIGRLRDSSVIACGGLVGR